MITEHTKEVLLVVINFGGHEGFEVDLQVIHQLLKEYANGQNQFKIDI
jgi:hypothetical protein